MTRTTFGKLALLLAMVGALALAGCGGGSDGSMGEAGPRGMVGPAGPQGETGPAGADGMDGADGADGATAEEVAAALLADPAAVAMLTGMAGADGVAPTVEEVAAALLADPAAVAMLTGPAGADGMDGADGADGMDGTSPTAEEVAAALLADPAAVAMLTGPAGADGMDGADGADGADGTAGAGVMLVDIWEEIAGEAIEAYLLMQVGTTGAVSVTDLKAAITATATKYGLSDTSALAYVDENYPQFEQLRRAEVTTALAGLHSAGTLAATRDAVAEVLMGEAGAAGAPGTPGTPAMDADPADVLAMAWEAIAGESIEASLEAQINTAAGRTGPVTHKQLSDAIKATAKAYGIVATDALATLNAANPDFATLLRTRADAIVAMIHEGDDLAATEESATAVIATRAAVTVDAQRPPAQTDAGAVANAAKAVAAMIEAELTGGLLDSVTVTTVVRDVITMYDGTMSVTEVTAAIDAAVKAAQDEIASPAVGAAATAKSIAGAVQVALAAAYGNVADSGDLPQVGPDGMLVAVMDDDDDMDGDDDTDVMDGTLAALLMMDGVVVTGTADASRKASDFSLPSGVTFKNEGRGIESFNTRVGAGFGGFSAKATDTADTVETLGLWADGVAAFVVLSGRVGVAGTGIHTAYMGVPTDAPTTTGRGRAFFNGRFSGVHSEDPGAAFDTATATTSVGVGGMVMGDVRLDVEFDTDGLATTMDATFDNFVERAAAHEHEFDGIAIGRRGSFEQTKTDASFPGHIEGQFYEASDGENVAGSVTLRNGTFDAASVYTNDSATDLIFDSTFTPVDAEADEASAYHIEGIFIATE